MPHLSFEAVSKSFGRTEVIHDFNAEVAENEFLVLLGPSGCGKSTMLRMIAGLTDVTSGEIRFDGQRVNELEPRERNIAFVFQSYALYPHMSVRQNIAFPLVMDHFKRIYHIPFVNMIARRMISRRPDVTQRVEQVARMLELEEYLDRRPATLSGGQRQRVAVGRALVRDPALYLLDEPLSNLDAKLRAQMRMEISTLYEKVQKTFVYVTHDQVEAMTMATRIIVLHEGVIQQIGTPENIYNRPENTFVARFIGSPPMNLIPADVAGGRAALGFGGQSLPAPTELADGAYLLGVRPEQVAVGAPESGLPARVRWVEFLGSETIVAYSLGTDALPDDIVNGGDSVFLAKLEGTRRIPPGTEVGIGIGPDDVAWFDAGSGQVARHAPSSEAAAAAAGAGRP
jgi:multiple sugar transport system ATP-binding protein